MSGWENRGVLVTGCTGFLGRSMVGELARRGARVVGLVRAVDSGAPFFARGLDRHVTIVSGVVEDYSILESALEDHGIDTVFHLAAQSVVDDASRNPMATFETNVRGTWNVLEACRRSETVSRVVVASSYVPGNGLSHTEEQPVRGLHPYDASKSCADLIAATYHRTYDTPACVIRSGNLFGPGDLNFSRIVPGTVRSVLLGEPPIIRSDGSPVRDYVHVEDVAAGYLLAAEGMDDPALRGRAFNLVSGEPLSVLELTRRVLHLAGREDLQPVIMNETRAEPREQSTSREVEQNRLGWKPHGDVSARLQETIEWYRDFLSETVE